MSWFVSTRGTKPTVTKHVSDFLFCVDSSKRRPDIVLKIVSNWEELIICELTDAFREAASEGPWVETRVRLKCDHDQFLKGLTDR